MNNEASEDETIPDDDEKRMMFIGIGVGLMILGIFLTTIWGGFGVVDEFRSQDWPETDVLSVEQDLSPPDSWTHVFFFHYEVNGQQYNTTFVCHINPNQGHNNDADGVNVQPWQTDCLVGSQDLLELESLAYNPEDPSEIDVHPGFTWEAIYIIYGMKLSPLGFCFVGYIFLMRGVKGPTYGPWAKVAEGISSSFEKMKQDKP
ncbi:MAG: hypothetical protein QF544_05280 [Candidatus Thalassarchaeaceae archaeon]|jgi:hypothetical protein|nr:hypothetical protein [Candidatus Thalassarchaeaceae archaeon]